VLDLRLAGQCGRLVFAGRIFGVVEQFCLYRQALLVFGDASLLDLVIPPGGATDECADADRHSRGNYAALLRAGIKT